VPDKDPLLYATLLGYGGIQDMWIGEFQLAQTRFQEALQITLQILPPDDEAVLNSDNNLGLAYGCEEDYARGENYLGRAEEIFRADPARYITKGILLNANTARNDYCSGKFKDAQRRLDSALAEAIEMESVSWQAA
jgi:tetratricopeptide (TPR) repeat protein